MANAESALIRKPLSNALTAVSVVPISVILAVPANAEVSYAPTGSDPFTIISDVCGTIFAANTETGVIDATSLAAKNQRRHLMEGRLNRPNSNTTSASESATQVGSSTPLAELNNLRANTGKTSYFTVFVEVRRSTAASSVDKILGKTCVPYPESMTFLCELHLP